MRFLLIIIILMAGLSDQAMANIRAAIHTYKGYGVHMNAPDKNLVVDHELMSVDCHIEGDGRTNSFCKVTATYFIHSPYTETKNYQLEFILPRGAERKEVVTDFGVSVNAVTVPVESYTQKKAYDEALLETIRNFDISASNIKDVWRGDSQYISNNHIEMLDPKLLPPEGFNITEEQLPDSIRLALSRYRDALNKFIKQGADPKTIPEFKPDEKITELLMLLREYKKEVLSRTTLLEKFPFVGQIKQGMNELTVSYTQIVSVNEVYGPSYFTSSDFVTYIDYFLQPLKEWKLGNQFYVKLEVSVNQRDSFLGNLFNPRHIDVRQCDGFEEVFQTGTKLPVCKQSLTPSIMESTVRKTYQFNSEFSDYIRILFGLKNDLNKY